MTVERAALAFLCVLVSGCPRQKPPAREADAAPHAAPAPSPSQVEPASEPTAAAFSERTQEREAFVQKTIEERDVRDPRVVAAMKKVPRHAFVLPDMRGEAYSDRPLPIVGGQTISQPYIVAFMTQASKPTKTSKCLEIGTGSGYQAAVLAELCASVYSIEYLPEVARFGEKNLRALGYGPGRVHLRTGDGYRGWPDAEPFDVIIVTAAPNEVPKPLLDQLGVGGRLVIPLGPEGGAQELERITRLREGSDEKAFEREKLMGVSFVPFLGEGAK